MRTGTALGLAGAVVVSLLLASSPRAEAPAAAGTAAVRPIAHEAVRYARDGVLDVLLPPPDRHAPAGGSPVVVLLHGCCGDRSDLGKLAEALSDAGLVVLNVDWPGMGAGARFPAAYASVACALRWARMHARELSGDPTRIVVAGWSDGAMVAAVVAAGGPSRTAQPCTGGEDAAAAERTAFGLRLREAPVAVVGIAGFYGWPLPVAGAYDVPRAEAFLGGAPGAAPAAWAEATPYHWLATAPPTHLLVGTTDPLVADARRYAAALSAAGRLARVVEIPPGGDQTLISPRSPEGRRVVAEISSIAQSLGREGAQ